MTRIPKMAQTAPTSRPRPVIGTTCKKIGSMEIFLWISIFLFELMEFCVFYHICICGVVFWYSMITILIYALKLFEINCQLKFYVFYVFNNKSVFSPLHTQRWSWWWVPTSRRPASFPLCPIKVLSRQCVWKYVKLEDTKFKITKKIIIIIHQYTSTT